MPLVVAAGALLLVVLTTVGALVAWTIPWPSWLPEHLGQNLQAHWLMGLSPTEADCRASGHGLVLAYWWEDYRLMRGLQNGLFQYQCPHAPRTSSQKWLPLGSLFPEGVSVASWLSGRLSNAREWVWSRLLTSSGTWSMWNFPCAL